MRKFLAILAITLLLATSACSTGLKRRGDLSPQEVQQYMQQGVIAGIFIGHKVNSITLDNGKTFTATLPDTKVIASYVEQRRAVGKRIDIQME